ncbi:MAG TPA: hypothetical protein VGM79_08525 [Streptosporangiaceae bacterium]|jgi:hypothetical protein
MPDDSTTEARLRELFREQEWSLPPWPDAALRVRRAARRQRVRSALAATGAGAVIIAIALSLALLRAPSPEVTSDGITNLLTCRDSAGQQDRDTRPARLANGVDGFIGDTNAYDTLPVQRVAGDRYLDWKSPLAVQPGSYRTVTVVSPASAWLDYGVGRVSPARAVGLPACGSRYTLYLGGILVRRPACVTLAVSDPAGKTALVTVPVLRGCPRATR